MKLVVFALLAAFSVSACDRDAGPPLQISDALLFAPMPGSSTSVAYMAIRNNTQADIEITSINSPQFDSVMLHETQIIDGVARMKMLRTLLVPAQSAVVLQEGSRHIMLMGPIDPVELGQSIALHIAFDTDGLVIVNTAIQSRFGFE